MTEDTKPPGPEPAAASVIRSGRNGTEDRPNPSTEQADARVLAARIRRVVAERRFRLADLEEIGVWLSAGRISASGAFYMLWTIGEDDDVLGREKAA